MLATGAALLVLAPGLALAMDMVTILSKIPPDPLEPYDKVTHLSGAAGAHLCAAVGVE